MSTKEQKPIFKAALVMNRAEVADTIHSILRVGRNLLDKEKINQEDHTKMKLIRTMGPALASAVAMVQQETAQQRMELVVERMKQLGYEPAQITS